MAGTGVADLFAARAEFTEHRLVALDVSLRGYAIDTARLRNAAIYATGSVGRNEAWTESDLDVFVIDTNPPDQRLTNIEQITLKADLIRASADAEFPPFSGDGEYLVVHPLSDLLDLLGGPDDDKTNFFTARMLLLLESRCLAGEAAYEATLNSIIERYWRDWAGHEHHFRPTFLLNDIVRFWKTLTLNYEWRRNKSHPADADSIAKHRLRNVKLGFSRAWTCHTGLAFIVAAAQKSTVSQVAAWDMASLTPFERMSRLADEHPGIRADVDCALDAYAWFLEFVTPTGHALDMLRTTEQWHEARRRDREFGDALFRVIRTLATDDVLRNLLV